MNRNTAERSKVGARARELVRSIYTRHLGGCCWHIVLDDENIDKDAVDWCVNNVDASHVDCSELAELAPQLSMTQWRRLCGS